MKDQEDGPGMTPRSSWERAHAEVHTHIRGRTWRPPRVDTLSRPVCSGTATRLHAHVPAEPWRFRPAGSGTPSGPRSVCTFNPETVSTEAWRRTKCQVCAERRCPLSWRATSWSVSEHGEPRRGRAFRAAAGAGLGAGRAALLRFQLLELSRGFFSGAALCTRPGRVGLERRGPRVRGPAWGPHGTHFSVSPTP